MSCCLTDSVAFKDGIKCQSSIKMIPPPEERSIYSEVEDFEAGTWRRQCMRIALLVVYTLLAVLACVASFFMAYDLINSLNHPVTSVQLEHVRNYTAPGIVVYPGGADFPACQHNYNNVVSSKVRIGDLNLTHRSCSFINVSYADPHYPTLQRNALVIRGPTNVEDREAVFLHFQLEDETRDFFTVSYFVFPDYDSFERSENRSELLQGYHRCMPTFALSAGLRMWIKLSMKQTWLLNETSHTEFKTEYSVVKFVDRRSQEERKRRLFFIFFEWKNSMKESVTELYTTSAWRFIAALCAVFLTIHKGFQMAQASYLKMQKQKRVRQSVKTLRQNSSRSQLTSSEKSYRRPKDMA